FVEMVSEHGLGTVDSLLRRLCKEHSGPMPPVLVGDKVACDAQQHSGMDVMTACMHHTHVLPVGGFAVDVGGVGQAGLFNDRQCIHVCTDQQRWAGAILQDADHSQRVRSVRVNADVVGDGVPVFA